MKFFVSQLMHVVRKDGGKRNLILLARFLVVLLAMIFTYSMLFHFIMLWEGREHSWITGFYWTLTVMSTTGFGDITFQSDQGRLFSMLVLISGIIFLLILLPFTFIQFFYAPWIEAQAMTRAPTSLPDNTRNHVIVANFDKITEGFIQKLKQFGTEYVLLAPDSEKAIRLADHGFRVMVGDFDDPMAYRNAKAESASLIVSTLDDHENTHVAFTARLAAPETPIATTFIQNQSADILRRAGANHLLKIREQMGMALARSASGCDARTHIVGQVDELLVAEASAAKTPLVGQTIGEVRLDATGVTVVGIWNRGVFVHRFENPVIEDFSVLVIVGTVEQLKAYDERFVMFNQTSAPVIVIGGGRVGQAAALALRKRGISAKIIERNPRLQQEDLDYIAGDASDLKILQDAGLKTAPAVIITTHDDFLNIYLTIYCRSLRDDIQIISRATLERHADSMHRAGADFVRSFSSMGARMLFNLIQENRVLGLDEDLEVFKTDVPQALVGKSIEESQIFQRTSCSLIATCSVDASVNVSPDETNVLQSDQQMILIGNVNSQAQYFECFDK